MGTYIQIFIYLQMHTQKHTRTHLKRILFNQILHIRFVFKFYYYISKLASLTPAPVSTTIFLLVRIRSTTYSNVVTCASFRLFGGSETMLKINCQSVWLSKFSGISVSSRIRCLRTSRGSVPRLICC